MHVALVGTALLTNAVLAMVYISASEPEDAPLLLACAIAPAVLLVLRCGSLAYRLVALALGIAYFTASIVIFAVSPVAPLFAGVALLLAALLPPPPGESAR